MRRRAGPALPAAPPERRTTEIDKQRVPMAAKPYRLLALVKQDAVVRVQKEPDDTVMTWPHLLSIEFFAAAVISIFLLLMGVFVNAPLEELANPQRDARPWPRRRGTSSASRSCWPTSTRRSPACSRPDHHPGRCGVIPYIDRGPTRRRWLAPPARPQDRASCSSRSSAAPGLVDHVPRRLLPRPRLCLVTLPWATASASRCEATDTDGQLEAHPRAGADRR